MGYIKLKEEIDFQELHKFCSWSTRTLIADPALQIPSLQWYSHWRNMDVHGMMEYIEINCGTREIKCQGCLDILFKMIDAEMVEVVEAESEVTAWMDLLDY